ncbi:MAG: DUF4350 domain-containing protein [Alphaproteobacteria bacterium]
MVDQPVFSPRTVFWLVAVGAVSFAGALFFMIFGDEFGVRRSAGANAYSISAIGHRAFVETLEEIGIPVLVSQSDSAGKAGASSLLVIAEPPATVAGDFADDAFFAADTILLVLPKWRGEPDPVNRRWLESVEPIARADAETILRGVVQDGRVRRVAGPVAWTVTRFGATPTLDAPQLMSSKAMRPLIAGSRGMLVGEIDFGWQRIWVLSDPDLLSNHGIGRGDNGVLAVNLVEAIRPALGAVIFDETVHGFRREASLSRTMLELPFVVTTILAAATLAVLLWAATARFGAPQPVERALRAGKASLIDSTAGLLAYGGHGREIFRRYLDVVQRDVARRVHAPRDLGDAAFVAWLDRVGTARGTRTSYRALRERAEALIAAGRADGARLARAALGLYRWKGEMLHGPGGHPVGQSTAQGTGGQGGRRAGAGS